MVSLLRQQQKLVMTMQMHQAFQLLQLQGLELEEALLEEVKENPALELVDQERFLSEPEMQRKKEFEKDQEADLEARNGSEENDFDWDAILENSVSGRSMRRGTIHSELPPVEHNRHMIRHFEISYVSTYESTPGWREELESLSHCLIQ